MTISFETFLLGVVIICFLLLPVLALTGNLWDWFYVRKINKTKVSCRLCGMRFYAEGKDGIVACPHCDALNKRN